MASQPIPRPVEDEDEPRLTREEGTALLMSMHGTFHDLYERSGGFEQVIRELRDNDFEPALR